MRKWEALFFISLRSFFIARWTNRPLLMYNWGGVKRRKIGDLVELRSVFWNFGLRSQLNRVHIKKHILHHIYTKVSLWNHLPLYVTVPFLKTQRIWAPLLEGKGADLVRLPRKTFMHFFNLNFFRKNISSIHFSRKPYFLWVFAFILHGSFLHLNFSGKPSFYMGFSWKQGIVKQQEQVKQWGGRRQVGWENKRRRGRKCRKIQRQK